jgi:hypothetical protein
MARSRRSSSGRNTRITAAMRRTRLRERAARDRAREAAAKETLRRESAAARETARERLFAAARARTQAIKAGRRGEHEAAARLHETAAELTRQRREAERGTAAYQRWLKSLVTPAKRRSPYQRRVVSGAVRQIERAEAAATLSDAQAIEQAKLRLRQTFPNSENYDNAFAALDYQPEVARALLALSGRQLWDLANDPSKKDTGITFSIRLRRLARTDVITSGVNPLFYHGEQSRFQYGI